MALPSGGAAAADPAGDDVVFEFERQGDELSLAFRPVGEIPLAVAERDGPLVRTLNLTETDLVSFDRLDRFPHLESLILDKNGLAGLDGCPRLDKLNTLWFNNNNVQDLPSFMDAVVERFPSLQYLSMMRNPACPGLMDIVTPDLEACRMYRMYTLYRLPNLLVLDSEPVTAEELQNAATRGQFAVKRTKVLAPAAAASASADAPIPFMHAATPETERGSDGSKDTTSSAVLGVSRRKYDGRHSEGNRFIRDQNL